MLPIRNAQSLRLFLFFLLSVWSFKTNIDLHIITTALGHASTSKQQLTLYCVQWNSEQKTTNSNIICIAGMLFTRHQLPNWSTPQSFTQCQSSKPLQLCTVTCQPFLLPYFSCFFSSFSFLWHTQLNLPVDYFNFGLSSNHVRQNPQKLTNFLFSVNSTSRTFRSRCPRSSCPCCASSPRALNKNRNDLEANKHHQQLLWNENRKSI